MKRAGVLEDPTTATAARTADLHGDGRLYCAESPGGCATARQDGDMTAAMRSEATRRRGHDCLTGSPSRCVACECLATAPACSVAHRPGCGWLPPHEGPA